MNTTPNQTAKDKMPDPWAVLGHLHAMKQRGAFTDEAVYKYIEELVESCTNHEHLNIEGLDRALAFYRNATPDANVWPILQAAKAWNKRQALESDSTVEGLLNALQAIKNDQQVQAPNEYKYRAAWIIANEALEAHRIKGGE